MITLKQFNNLPSQDKLWITDSGLFKDKRPYLEAEMYKKIAEESSLAKSHTGLSLLNNK